MIGGQAPRPGGSRAAALTIAIPFYDGVAYLREAIESVRAQSTPDWRLLVSDDGEEDQDVGGVVAEYSDPRIRYVRNDTNVGMVRNWNLCIDRAETDLVSLLHGDDRLLPGYAGIVTSLAARHPAAAALFCAASIIDAAGRPSFSVADFVKGFLVPRGDGDVVLAGEEALRAIMAGNFIMCPTLCLRKSVLGPRRFPEGWQQVQDLELTSRLLMQGETLVGSREHGYAYRRHPGNATELQSDSLLRFEEEYRLFERVAQGAARLGWRRAARTAERAALVKLHLVFRSLRDLLRLRPTRGLEKLRFLWRHRRRGAP